MKILVVDNNVMRECWGAADLSRYAAAAPGATVHVRRGPQEDLPRDPAAYDRIVVSGSLTSALEDAPWISHQEDFMRRAIERGVPLLGVCFGHQILCRAFGGMKAVRKTATPEFGWTKIEITKRSRLFEGLPDVFHSFSSHFDEVSELPKGFSRIASSEGCAIQACELDGRPAFGIQFHPEKTLEEGTKTLAERKKKGEPKVLLNADRGPKLYDPKVAEKIFGNFFGPGILGKSP